MSRSDCRNIEIKAKLADQSELIEKINIAKELTGETEGKILIQKDVFFKVSNGRLKLRYEDGSSTKLIQYDRDNVKGPKLSKFNILELSDGNLLEKMLDNSIGILGILEKTRHLFMYNRTRIHLDTVKNMDIHFYGMEFEVKMELNEDVEVSNKIVDDLMEKFKLTKDQLLEGSYFEILNP